MMLAIIGPSLIRIAGMFAFRRRRGHYGGCGSLPVGCGRSGSAAMCGYGSLLWQDGGGCGGGGILLPVLLPPDSSSSSSSVA